MRYKFKARCAKHNRIQPCKLCVKYRGARGGSSKSKRKLAAIAANLKKARARRWAKS